MPLKLPCGRTIRVNELKNREYLNIVKYCENGDFDGFLQTIRTKLIPDFNDLNVVEKACALVAYRIMFLGDELTLINAEHQQVRSTASSILEKLEEVDVDRVDFELDGFKAVIGNIKDFTTDDFDIYSCVESIEYQNATVTGDDVISAIDVIPVAVSNALGHRILEVYKYYNNVEIVSADPRKKMPSIKISLVDTSFSIFIMSIFTSSLELMFDTVFIFSQHFQNVDYFDLSPLDSKVLENILRREHAEAKNESSTQSQHSNPLTPSL